MFDGCERASLGIAKSRAEAGVDDVVDMGDAKVFVNPEATLFLLGTEMDFEVTKLRTGFVFNNPNQTSACGCGESVELTPVDAAAVAEARN